MSQQQPSTASAIAAGISKPTPPPHPPQPLPHPKHLFYDGVTDDSVSRLGLAEAWFDFSSALLSLLVTLLFHVKTESPPLLFCLLIYHFLSSVSIKPMTAMLVFLRCVCVCMCVYVCVCGALICFCKRLGLS